VETPKSLEHAGESMKSVMVVAGTRPEIIKMVPIIKQSSKLGIDIVFVWSGQHYDYALSKIFFEQLGFPEPDECLDVGSGTHAEQTAKVMLGLERVIKKFKPQVVVAEGDTNTVAATAMSSVKCQVPFAHVEAGLRSWNMAMPEEVNRKVADSIASVHFAPTKLAALNLLFEGVSLRGLHLTGNTIVDMVSQHVGKAQEVGKKLREEMNLDEQYLLVTLHRAENVDDSERLKSVLVALKRLSEEFKVVFSIHPRTKQKITVKGMVKYLNSVLMLPPLGYFEFLGLLLGSTAILTDSGGVQEEAFTLKIPTVTLRYNTERPETFTHGVNVLAGADTQSIVNLTNSQVKRLEEIKKVDVNNPFGDGCAGERIAKVLKTSVESGFKIEEPDLRGASLITYKLMQTQQVVDRLNIEELVELSRRVLRV